jgi:hypothetical protein
MIISALLQINIPYNFSNTVLDFFCGGLLLTVLEFSCPLEVVLEETLGWPDSPLDMVAVRPAYNSH